MQPRRKHSSQTQMDVEMQEEQKRDDVNETTVPEPEAEFFDPWQQAFSEDLKRQQQEFEY